MMVERDLRLVEMTGGRLPHRHVSTAAAVDAIRSAKARGLPVTCDTAPPYFALNEIAVGDYRTFAKLSPPLRGEGTAAPSSTASRTARSTPSPATTRRRTRTASACPSPRRRAASSALETLLPLSLELYHNGHLPLLAVLRALTQRPAEILRLPAGQLAVGAAADLVIFDLERPWRIDVDALRSKSKNSPYDGRPVQGHVLRTVIAGRSVFIHEAE